MFDLDSTNAVDYLVRVCGRATAPWRITPLGGGVSNTVLLVENGPERFILKQALGKLRVEQDWFSDKTRIFREAEAMNRLAPWLPDGSVPRILFEDRSNFVFAMTAAPSGAVTWKDELLRGITLGATSFRVAEILTRMIRVSHEQPEWRKQFSDQTVFDQLRLDPYYRSTAARNPDLQAFFEGLIHQSQTRDYSLVHGDYSPKNFLVHEVSVMAIDFEVIHFGDPSFDAGFLLNHLLLKSFHRPDCAGAYAMLAEVFWGELLAGLPGDSEWFESSTIAHLAGLLLARIDGKSPAEYIKDPDKKQRIREFARDLAFHPPRRVLAVFDRLNK